MDWANILKLSVGAVAAVWVVLLPILFFRHLTEFIARNVINHAGYRSKSNGSNRSHK